MCIQSPNEGPIYGTGIQRSSTGFDEHIHEAVTLLLRPGFTIDPDHLDTADTIHIHFERACLSYFISLIRCPILALIPSFECGRSCACTLQENSLRFITAAQVSALISHFAIVIYQCVENDTAKRTLILKYYALFRKLPARIVLRLFRIDSKSYIFLCLVYVSIVTNLTFNSIGVSFVKSEVSSDFLSLIRDSNVCFPLVLVAIITVSSLYAGTLVTYWTTAPSNLSRSALLAAFCLFLATLTVAARCYASANATDNLVQLPEYPQFARKDSTFKTHSSNIVLSKNKNPFRSQNSLFARRKRDIEHQQIDLNSFKNYDNKPLKRLEKNFPVTKVPYVYAKTIQNSNDVNASPETIISYRLKDPQLATDARTSNKLSKRILKSSRHSITFLKDANSLNLEKRFDTPVISANGSEGSSNRGENTSRVSNTLQVVDRRQNDGSYKPVTDQQATLGFNTERPMPPADDHGSISLTESSVFVLVVSVVVLTVALGLVTCVLSHYRGGTAANPHDAAQTPTTAPMLSVVSAGAAAGVGGMDRLHGRGAARELAATRDRQVRLHTVHTDIAINLPPNIELPDGEEHPFSSSRLHIRDTEQESEIYQKCIKPPPNRTVLESESPPPYRSSSAGLLGSIGGSSSGSSDWSGGSAPLVVRCHSLSSTSKRPEAGTSGQKTDFIQRTVKIFTGKNKNQQQPPPTLPVVIVPSRSRHISDEQQNTTGRPKPNV